MCDTNIHKVLQIIHITSVKCDIKVKGVGGHRLSVTMTLSRQSLNFHDFLVVRKLNPYKNNQLYSIPRPCYASLQSSITFMQIFVTILMFPLTAGRFYLKKTMKSNRLGKVYKSHLKIISCLYEKTLFSVVIILTLTFR